MPIHPDDPVAGPSDALVTVVAFSDFESPPAKRAAQTLTALRHEFPRDLRVVWKDDPLPFNPHARAAARFARSVHAQRGTSDFWRAHDLLFENQANLNPAGLRAIAAKLGIPWSSLDPENATSKVLAKVDQNIELARDVEARGTPHFFINGVRLPGAKPIEKFRERIRAALTSAQALEQTGINRAEIYEHILRTGKQLPVPDKRDLPPPSAPAPFLGAPKAKVVIQYWSTFPCETCARTMFLLYDLVKEYPKDVQIIWRNAAAAPSSDPFRAAQALREVFSQKGAAAFWPYHNRLLESQGAPVPFSPTSLEKLAQDLELDVPKFKRALTSNKHAAMASADAAVAQQAGLTTVPSFTVNGYVLSGAPSPSEFRRMIQRALREAGGR
ncbi:MAG: thioredoxin domain-containing protein [Polyangiaceae bacterium]|nr:thioredoxin domain-containing protein [Polyangiaceae bacterium]